MPRNSHTITNFRGVDYTSSLPNIPFDHAIDSLNIYGDLGGYLSQFQQPSLLLDYSTPSNLAQNLASTLSLGQLASPSSYPRLLIQQGANILYSDYPYSSSSLLSHPTLAGLLARLDYILCNGILYFSNGQDGGYCMPAAATQPYTTRYQWGISPPVSPTLLQASTSWVAGSITVQRISGVSYVTFTSAINTVPPGFLPVTVGSPIYIDDAPGNPWDSSFCGLFQIVSIAESGTYIGYAQPGLPNSGPFTRASYPSGISATTGWEYGACYGSQNLPATGHWSSLSPYSVNTGAVSSLSPTVLVPPTTDWQVDSVAFFRNQDGVVVGGGSWYLNTISSIMTTGPYAGWTVLCDTMTDEVLATSGQTAPYDNGISPNGKYLAVWLDRVLMCGILNDPTGVRYTGVETINFGRPQMSWCQFNEIKLGEGQATPMGMGLLRYGGMVFFATDGFMYIYRGTLNDISVSAPTSLSFYAEQMPYSIGLYSHYTIQSSAAGLIWLDDGFNLRLMDNTGFYPPKAIAPNLSGLFKRITPGSQDMVTSVHFDYLQRDWYVISFPIDGSLINNMTVVLDVSADPGKNTGAWPVQHSISDMVWAIYPDSSCHLLASLPQLISSSATSIPPVAGYLAEIPIQSPIVQGAISSSQIALSSPNPPMPNGFWQGGYFGLRDEQGEDEYSLMKMFRYCRLSGSLASGFKVQANIVDGETLTWDTPGVYSMASGPQPNVLGINKKGRALSPKVIFPSDAIATLTSLMVAWNVTGER